jgi:hypothetical protein
LSKRQRTGWSVNKAHAQYLCCYSFHVALSKSTNRNAQRELEQHPLAEYLKRSKASNIEVSHKIL